MACEVCLATQSSHGSWYQPAPRARQSRVRRLCGLSVAAVRTTSCTCATATHEAVHSRADWAKEDPVHTPVPVAVTSGRRSGHMLVIADRHCTPEEACMLPAICVGQHEAYRGTVGTLPCRPGLHQASGCSRLASYRLPTRGQGWLGVPFLPVKHRMPCHDSWHDAAKMQHSVSRRMACPHPQPVSTKLVHTRVMSAANCCSPRAGAAFATLRCGSSSSGLAAGPVAVSDITRTCTQGFS